MTGSAPRRALVASLVLAVAVAATYAGVLDAPFFFDDNEAIVENESIRSLGASFSPPVDTTVAGRPLVNFTLALNYAAGGLEIRGYHLVNLGIHVVCALLVLGILRRTLPRLGLPKRLRSLEEPLAFAAALAWAVHPMNSEVVLYVVSRTETVMATFFLLTLYAALRSLEGGRRKAWRAVAVASCALGMLSKEVMFAAPILVLLYDRTFVAGTFAGAWRERRGLHAALLSTWLVLFALIAASPRGQSVGFHLAGGPLDYLEAQCTVLPHYLAGAFWPSELIFDYGILLPMETSAALPGGLLMLALLAVTLVALARWPRWGFAGACFFVILAPSSSFVPIVTEIGSDRRMYLPLVALVTAAVVAVAWLVDALLRRLGARDAALRPVLALAGVAVVAALVVRTRARAEDFADIITIWTRAAEARPENVRPHYRLGAEYLNLGRPADALEPLARAVDLLAGEPDLHRTYGVALSQVGRNAEAERELRLALRAQPDYPQASLALANVLASQGRGEDALRELDALLERHRGHAEALALRERIERVLGPSDG